MNGIVELYNDECGQLNSIHENEFASDQSQSAKLIYENCAKQMKAYRKPTTSVISTPAKFRSILKTSPYFIGMKLEFREYPLVMVHESCIIFNRIPAFKVDLKLYIYGSE